jgi:type I restriction enzyme, S subunit
MVDTAGHGTGKLDTDLLKSIDVVLPPIPEQRRIAQILATWDQAIATAERLLNKSFERKRGLARELLQGKMRSKQFTSPWLQLTFRDVLKEVKRRVEWDDDQDYPLISVRRRSEGAFHRETLKGSEILTKKLNYAYAGEFLISKMQVVHGAMAVVPDALDGMFISDSYLAFQSADIDRFDINFIGWLSTTQQTYKAVRRCSYGVHIEKMTFDVDMFLNEKFQVPADIEEQRFICSVLKQAESEANTSKTHLEQLKREKSALMSQLLTGKRRIKLPDAEAEVQA